MTITLRKISIVGFLICAFALVGAVYIEHNYLISPCPLCMLQRYAYGLLAFIFLLGSILNLKAIFRYIYYFFVLCAAGIGCALAAYQFRLQYFAAPQKVSCSASLERLIELHPFLDALKIALQGSPECSKVDMAILGISLAGWSTIMFGLVIIFALYFFYLEATKKMP